MSLTLLVFVLLFAWLTLMAFQRPIYGVALYFLTYFGDPASWWWGVPLLPYRLNLFASIVAITSALLYNPPRFRNLKEAWCEILLVLIVLNATVVHFLVSDRPDISLKAYDLLVKFAILAILIKSAVQSREDLYMLMVVLTIAVGHIGFEVKVNDAGAMVKGRLEQVGPPTANSSNQLASLLATVLPMVGTLAIVGIGRQKLIAIASAPFAANTLLLCNSRGAFLGSICSGIVFLILAPAKARRIAFSIVLLGGCVFLLLARDERIFSRFESTFASSEERDASAANRLDYWKAGLAMVKDYPLGQGGDSFKKVHGVKYRAQFGHNKDVLAVHNGFINEACQWGVIGFTLRVTLYFLAVLKSFSLSRQLSRQGEPMLGLVVTAVSAGLAGFLVTSVFGDHFDNEWGMWLVAISAASESLAARGVLGTERNAVQWYRIVPAPAIPQRPLAPARTELITGTNR